MSRLLPIDVEREIFETAAVRDHRSIPTLLRVCHRAHTWVEPLLYTTLIIFDWNTPLVTAVKSKSAQFLNATVRHALIYVDTARDTVTAAGLLSKCSQIATLVIGGDVEPELLDSLDAIRPQKLDISVPREHPSDWGVVTLKRPFFLSVTHLSLVVEDLFSLHQFQWHDWNSLASLPALTHLSLSDNLTHDILPDVLAECPRVRLVITPFCGDYQRETAIAFAQSITVRDPRVVVMLMDADYIKDWRIGTQGGADYWVRGEEFVARKRDQVETEAIRYFLDDIEVAI
ncbi:hypothetical protein DFH06DRAFT_258318 [Mycena polygramma]|nr:hypothetical protein DFH06DRAFT_258318 [Mycena polygramma]